MILWHEIEPDVAAPRRLELCHKHLTVFGALAWLELRGVSPEADEAWGERPPTSDPRHV